MKEKVKKEYKPQATLQELLEFRSRKPETHTPSPFLNAYLTILNDYKVEEKEIAEIMGLPLRQFACAFYIEARMTCREFRNYWLAYNINRAIKEKPGIDGDELAQRVGYKDRSGLWRFVNSKTYKSIAKSLNFHIFPEPQHESVRYFLSLRR